MRPRAKRTELEEAVSHIVIDAVIEHNPGLRDAIRDLLNKGVTPADLKRKYGHASRRGKRYDDKATSVALTVDWLIDEWEREKGMIKPTESIDHVQYE